MIHEIEQNLAAIRALCREFGVVRLEVFGSAMTDAFDPARSDIDFLVAYPPGYDYGPWLTRYSELEERLAAVLGRKVDLTMPKALENKWFRREADKTRALLYDAAHVSEVA